MWAQTNIQTGKLRNVFGMFANWWLHHLRICKASLCMLDGLRLAQVEAKDCSEGNLSWPLHQVKIWVPWMTVPRGGRGGVDSRRMEWGSVCEWPHPWESAHQHYQSRSLQCHSLINVYADYIEGKKASGNVKMDNPDSKRNPENSSKYAILWWKTTWWEWEELVLGEDLSWTVAPVVKNL